MSDESIDRSLLYSGTENGRLTARMVSLAGIALVVVAILALALPVGSAYHALVFSGPGPLEKHFAAGLVASIFYVITTAKRDGYGMSALISRFRPAAALGSWSFAFGGVLATGFILEFSDSYSRGTLLLICLAGNP